MKDAAEQPHTTRQSGSALLYIIIACVNALAFLFIGLVYMAYTRSYSQKLYNENLNNVASLNMASANAAETYISSMGVKLDDVVSYIEANELTYQEVLQYIGESNTNTDRQFQLILCGRYENGVLEYGDYTGVSVRKKVSDGGTLQTLTREVNYAKNYSDFVRSLKDIDDTAFEGICFAPEFTDADTKFKCFAIYRHVLLENEADTGVYALLLSINASKALHVYNFQTKYDGQSTVLINASGDYIIKSNDYKDLNFYEYLRSYNDLSLDQMTALRQDVLNSVGNGHGDRSVNLFYKDYEGKDCVFCVTGMANGWYSITCVPQSSFHLSGGDVNYSLIILTLFIVLFAIDGVVIYFVGKEMKRNVIIAEKAKEEANNANQAKSRFLSTMSHELRTPLNAITGLVALSGDNIGNPEILTDYFKKIDASSKLLLQLISDILDVSAIESNKMKINHSTFDLTKVISSLSSIYYAQCFEKGIEFDAVLKNMHTETLIGDSTRLNQILLNFLSNAVKFTPRGGRITLRVDQRQATDTTVLIRFDVIDTGCGISDELKTRLFKPFEQESGDTARRYGGTGLGLSIAKNLTELMNGRVEVESEVGKGTRFSVEIPFDIPAEKAPARFNALSDLKTLLVAGDADTRAYLEQLLSQFGVTHRIADGSRSALALLQAEERSEHPYDLCILDWKTSDADAMRAASVLREAYTGESLLIMVLAYDLAMAKPKCLEAGVDVVLEKPIFPSDLYNALEEITAGHAVSMPASESISDFSGKRVLLVEDNKLNIEIARLLLEKTGLMVEVAENGQLGCDAFTASPHGYFDAILMDIQMPVMNGYQATSAIRASAHPQAAQIPIIAMTADAFSADVEKAAAAGMNTHLSKPVELALLYEILREYIS